MNYLEIEQIIQNQSFKDQKLCEQVTKYILQFDIFKCSTNPVLMTQCVKNMIPHLSIKKFQPLEQIYIYEQEQDTIYFVMSGQAGMYLPNGELEKLNATKIYQEYKKNTMSLDSFYELREENLQKQKQLLLKQKDYQDNIENQSLANLKPLQNSDEEIETLNINEQLLVEKIDKLELEQEKIQSKISEEIRKANELNKQKGDNYINTKSLKENNMYSLVTIKQNLSTFGQYSMYFGGRRWQTMANYSQKQELVLCCIQGNVFHQIFSSILNDVYFVYLRLISNFNMIKSLAENLALASEAPQNYGLKQEIYKEGEVSKGLYFVKQGVVQMQKLYDVVKQIKQKSSKFVYEDDQAQSQQNDILKQEIVQTQRQIDILQDGSIFGYESFQLSSNLRYCQAISTSYDTHIIQIPYNKIKMVLQYNSEKNIIRSLALQHLLELEKKSIQVKSGIQNVIESQKPQYQRIASSLNDNFEKTFEIFNKIQKREREFKQNQNQNLYHNEKQLIINEQQQSLEQQFPKYTQNINKNPINNANTVQKESDFGILNQSAIQKNGQTGANTNYNIYNNNSYFESNGNNQENKFYQHDDNQNNSSINNYSNFYSISPKSKQNLNSVQKNEVRAKKQNGMSLLTKSIQKQTQNEYSLSPVKRGEADLNQYKKIKSQNKLQLGQERITLININNKIVNKIQREQDKKQRTLKGEYYDDENQNQTQKNDTEGKRQMGKYNNSFKDINEYDKQQQEMRVKRMGISTNFRINPHVDSLEQIQSERKKKKTWKDKDQVSQYEKHSEYIQNQINDDKDIIKKLEKSIFRPKSTKNKKTIILSSKNQNNEELENLSQEVQRRKEKYKTNILDKSEFLDQSQNLQQSNYELNEEDNEKKHQKSQFKLQAENNRKKSNVQVSQYFRILNSQRNSQNNLNNRNVNNNQTSQYLELEAQDNENNFCTEQSNSNIKYMENSLNSVNQTKSDNQMEKDVFNLNLQQQNGRNSKNGALLERGFFNFRKDDREYVKSLNMSPLKAPVKNKILKTQLNSEKNKSNIVTLDDQLELVESGFIRSLGMRQDISERQKLKKHNLQLIQMQTVGNDEKTEQKKQNSFLPRIKTNYKQQQHQQQYSKSMLNLDSIYKNRQSDYSQVNTTDSGIYQNKNNQNLILIDRNEVQERKKGFIQKQRSLNNIYNNNIFSDNNLAKNNFQHQLQQLGNNFGNADSKYDLTYKEKQNLNEGQKHWLKQSNAFQSLQRKLYDQNLQNAKQNFQQKNKNKFY